MVYLQPSSFSDSAVDHGLTADSEPSVYLSNSVRSPNEVHELPNSIHRAGHVCISHVTA